MMAAVIGVPGCPNAIDLPLSGLHQLTCRCGGFTCNPVYLEGRRSCCCVFRICFEMYMYNKGVDRKQIW